MLIISIKREYLSLSTLFWWKYCLVPCVRPVVWNDRKLSMELALLMAMDSVFFLAPLSLKSLLDGLIF
jgi:hypothetical protein